MMVMESTCSHNGSDESYRLMARAQDAIGWRWFMEGMECREIREI